MGEVAPSYTLDGYISIYTAENIIWLTEVLTSIKEDRLKDIPKCKIIEDLDRTCRLYVDIFEEIRWLRNRAIANSHWWSANQYVARRYEFWRRQRFLKFMVFAGNRMCSALGIGEE